MLTIGRNQDLGLSGEVDFDLMILSWMCEKTSTAEEPDMSPVDSFLIGR